MKTSQEVQYSLDFHTKLTLRELYLKITLLKKEEQSPQFAREEL